MILKRDTPCRSAETDLMSSLKSLFAFTIFLLFPIPLTLNHKH
ncbi:hypothetical protein RQM43_19080 [Citrobacter portucalensis]|nr:hypothetical protein [Citrobacter portucalensis]ALD78660.1 hypothetical protein P10159_3911 [Citrobacter portucalensis]MDT7481922.1 hypothetical protein [Citrobacter portucalensis]